MENLEKHRGSCRKYYQEHKRKYQEYYGQYYQNHKEKILERSKREWRGRFLGLIKLKLQYVKELGGKCSKCGYDRNFSALEFHHMNGREDGESDPNEEIGSPNFDVSKLILLCANCHREIEHPSCTIEESIKAYLTL